MNRSGKRVRDENQIYNHGAQKDILMCVCFREGVDSYRAGYWLRPPAVRGKNSAGTLTMSVMVELTTAAHAGDTITNQPPNRHP